MTTQLLTVPEAAEFLRVHPWQVRHYIKMGWLSAHRIGGDSTSQKGDRRRWRIDMEDLEIFLNRNTPPFRKRKAKKA